MLEEKICKLFICKEKIEDLILKEKIKLGNLINPLTSHTVFTSPYLSAGAPALGEAKGLIIFIQI